MHVSKVLTIGISIFLITCEVAFTQQQNKVMLFARQSSTEEDQSSPPPSGSTEGSGSNTLDSRNFWNQRLLTGNWGGTREALSLSGVEFEGSYKGDSFIGQRASASYLHNLDLKLSLDLGTGLGLEGVSIELYALGNGGSKPSDRMKVAQPVSSIETLPDLRLYTAALQYSFLEERVSMLLGLYDLNSEFCVLASAAPFVNSSFGIGPEIAQTGQAGPSIFPVTSAGIRLFAAPCEGWSVACAVLDGVPGDPNDPTGTHIQFNAGDGALIAAEVSHEGDEAGTKVGIGFWSYTAAFEDLAEVTTSGVMLNRRNNAGIYAIAEGAAFLTNLNVFIRIGTANAHLNRFDLSVAGGINLHSLFYEEDLLAVGFSTVRNGWEYRQVGDPNTLSSETVFEATYVAPLTPWLTVQPDVQLFVSPDGDVSRPMEAAAGMRISLVF